MRLGQTALHACSMLVSFAIVAASVSGATAAPVTGNLVITSGHGSFLGPIGGGDLSLSSISGAGFSFPSLSLEQIVNLTCPIMGRAGDRAPTGGFDFIEGFAGLEATILGVRYVVPTLPPVVPPLPVTFQFSASRPSLVFWPTPTRFFLRGAALLLSLQHLFPWGRIAFWARRLKIAEFPTGSSQCGRRRHVRDLSSAGRARG